MVGPDRQEGDLNHSTLAAVMVGQPAHPALRIHQLNRLTRPPAEFPQLGRSCASRLRRLTGRVPPARPVLCQPAHGPSSPGSAFCLPAHRPSH